MKKYDIPRRLLLAVAVSLSITNIALAQSDPLPSWNDGAHKRAIIDFVNNVTKPGGPHFVAAPQRIATFDNDGTLWSEQPIYFQLAFALDRVKVLAPQHPEWKTQPPFKGVLEGDMMKAVVASGEKGLLELLLTTHTGMSTDEFTRTVVDWLITAQHPTRKKSYTDLVFQPMLELLATFVKTDSKRGTGEIWCIGRDCKGEFSSHNPRGAQKVARKR